MTDSGIRTRQIGTSPADRENIRVFAGGFGNRLFTEKAGSRHFPSIRPSPGLSLIGTSLLGLYWRNLISTPLAFLMVLALNLFTPLGFFDEVRDDSGGERRLEAAAPGAFVSTCSRGHSAVSRSTASCSSNQESLQWKCKSSNPSARRQSAGF